MRRAELSWILVLQWTLLPCRERLLASRGKLLDVFNQLSPEIFRKLSHRNSNR